MKVLFLDIDGVLNTDHRHIEPVLCAKVERVLDATGAVVVLSSSWRNLIEAQMGTKAHYDEARALLVGNGMTERLFEAIVSQTRNLTEWDDAEGVSLMVGGERGHRAREILDWLEAWQGEVTAWVVVDDMGLWVDGLPKWQTVITSGRTGITDADADEMIRILQR